MDSATIGILFGVVTFALLFSGMPIAFALGLSSLAFCAFVAWNAWQLSHHAWIEGHRLDGAFDPKIWPVYALMAFGMTTLSLQLLVQLLTNLRNPKATGIADQEPEIAKWSE